MKPHPTHCLHRLRRSRQPPLDKLAKAWSAMGDESGPGFFRWNRLDALSRWTGSSSERTSCFMDGRVMQGRLGRVSSERYQQAEECCRIRYARYVCIMGLVDHAAVRTICGLGRRRPDLSGYGSHMPHVSPRPVGTGSVFGPR